MNKQYFRLAGMTVAVAMGLAVPMSTKAAAIDRTGPLTSLSMTGGYARVPVTSLGSIPNHVPLVAFSSQGPPSSPCDFATYAQYANFTMKGNCSQSVEKASGMISIRYTDPNQVNQNGYSGSLQPGSIPYAPTVTAHKGESIWAHTCGNTGPTGRAAVTWNGQPYNDNVGTEGGYVAFFPDYINSEPKIAAAYASALIGDHGNWYELDDWHTPADTYGPPSVVYQPCNFNMASWLKGMVKFANQTNKPGMLNLLGSDNGTALSPEVAAVLSSGTSNVSAVLFENCAFKSNGYEEDSTQSGFTDWDLQAAIDLHASGRFTMCLDYSYSHYGFLTKYISNNYQSRLFRYVYAQLTQDAAFHSVGWDSGSETPSGVGAEPEDNIVPTNPLINVTNASQLEAGSSGVWYREYANCYYKTMPIGGCAMIENISATTKAMPTLVQQYKNSVTVAGEGVVTRYGDNGTINLAGAPVPTSLAPYTAAILTAGTGPAESSLPVVSGSALPGPLRSRRGGAG